MQPFLELHLHMIAHKEYIPVNTNALGDHPQQKDKMYIISCCLWQIVTDILKLLCKRSYKPTQTEEANRRSI